MKINRFWKETIENKQRVLKKRFTILHYFHMKQNGFEKK